MYDVNQKFLSDNFAFETIEKVINDVSDILIESNKNFITSKEHIDKLSELCDLLLILGDKWFEQQKFKNDIINFKTAESLYKDILGLFIDIGKSAINSIVRNKDVNTVYLKLIAFYQHPLFSKIRRGE